ncbi:hypothetical protein CR513_36300, partial [Mucuna pruriens]
MDQILVEIYPFIEDIVDVKCAKLQASLMVLGLNKQTGPSIFFLQTSHISLNKTQQILKVIFLM